MRIAKSQRLLCALSLLTVLPTVLAVPPPVDVSTSKNLDSTSNSRSSRVGTEHAPVDGKDGIPKQGPWVETTAERQRKKTAAAAGRDDDDDNNDYADDDEDDDRPLSSSKTKPKKTSDRKLNVDSDIPQSNDGVMDDKSRSAPKEGTRGTEGGISSKNKETSLDDSKKPDAPKEPLPLPHSEQTKSDDALDTTTSSKKTGTDSSSSSSSSSHKIEKPNELPYSVPEKLSKEKESSSLVDENIPKDEHRLTHHPSGSRLSEAEAAKADIVSPMHSLFLAFTMILFSEIGDKTFLVACLMAMRHDRLLVFSAAFSALVTMTVLSAVLGHAVPTLIPKWLTNFLAAGLFLVFGVKMLFEARAISPDEGVSEEMKEVEQELEEKEQEELRRNRRRSSVSPYVLESGRGIRKGRSDGRLPSPPDSPLSDASRDSSPSRSTIQNAMQGCGNLFSLLLSPAWVQTFVMTFLGEWGDRSQIATIAMAAGSDYWWVTGGALGGHFICTGVAVIGGKAIAGKVSLRTVTMGGAIAFLVFGVVYLLEAIY